MLIINDFINKDIKIDKTIVKWLERLKGITGFVSIIGNDPRIEIFNRYNHVLRVTNLVYKLASLQKNININKCILLALLHDINRLPFAHLLEKRIEFHQADFLKPFFDLMKLDFDEEIMVDLSAILQKSTNGSKEASLVFIADCIDGFIEDSLFAFTVFGLEPIDIPTSLINKLGYNELDNFNENLEILKNKFLRNNDFSKMFNEKVLEYSIHFGNKHDFINLDSIDINKFHSIRQELKNDLLVSMIFPINNEKVSQGNKLYNEFFRPYIETQRIKNKDFILNLFQMTDEQMLEDADNKAILKCKKEELFPILTLI